MATRNHTADRPTGAQENSNHESRNLDIAPQPAESPYWYGCDCCNRNVPKHEARHNCQECHDFDYCGKCLVDAALIHPGHHFTKVDAPEPPPEHEGEVANSELQESPPWQPACKSCAPVTRLLPLLQFAPNLERNELCMRWSLRLSTLIEAAQRDCAFCCFFLHTFFRESNMESHFYHDEKTPWYARPWGCRDEKERMELIEHCMGTLTRLKTDRFNFEVLPICSDSRKGVQPWDFDKLKFRLAGSTFDLHGKEELRQARVFHSAGAIEAERYVYAAGSDPASQHISSRPPNPSAASPEGIKQVKTWISDCEQHHGTTCRPSATGALPSRVIDVSDPSTLYLHTVQPNPTSPSPLRYAALSYCWGGPQLVRTTLATLPSRQQNSTGFPATSLPPTLLDAVRLAQSLDIPYLWIDSLCIIQDCPHDRAHELARMSDIYKNAFLTIVAARARSTDDGFLADRASPDTGLWKALVPLAYPLPHPEAATFAEALALPRPPGGSAGTLYLQEEPASMSGTLRDPVSERAWCLQERVLSPRVVSYGRWATWRCNGAVASDGGFYLREGREESGEGEDGGGDAAVRRLTQALVMGEGEDPARRKQLLGTWRAIVQDYTRRKLTLSTDKMPAIAGVAREISKLTGMEYLGGLWRENMLQDLMWYARTHEWRNRPAYPDGFPQAPTWSWAAVEAPALCDAVTEDSTPLARVLSCEVQQVGDRPTYDAISGGTVEIQGPFAELETKDVVGLLKKQGYSPAPPMGGDVQEWYRNLLEHMSSQPSGNVSLDDVENALPDKVFGLALFERGWTKNRWDHDSPKVMEPCYSGLLLQEVAAGRYERIGAFWNDTSSCVDQSVSPWAERTVVLV